MLSSPLLRIYQLLLTLFIQFFIKVDHLCHHMFVYLDFKSFSFDNLLTDRAGTPAQLQQLLDTHVAGVVITR